MFNVGIAYSKVKNYSAAPKNPKMAKNQKFIEN